MNKNGVMTALLAIEMITVFILGIWVACNYTDVRRIKEENAALQARVEEMQKSNTQLNALVKTQTRDKEDCLVLSKVSRGIWEKQVNECRAKLKDWVASTCGFRCSILYEWFEVSGKGLEELSSILKEKK